MKHLKRFNETLKDFTEHNQEFVDHLHKLDLSDLLDMCKYDSKYFSKEEKEICSKFLEDNIVTDDLLKLYCLYQIESWGDLYDIVEFIYNDSGPGNSRVIYGKYFNQDYPAKVSFDINEMNTPPKSSSNECSFETFKDIMLDLSDNYECELTENIQNPFKYYSCSLILPENLDHKSIKSYCDGLNFGVAETFRYRLLPAAGWDPSDDIRNDIFTVVNNELDKIINDLNDFKSKIDNNIESIKKVKYIFDVIQNDIIPKFQYFNNFKKIQINITKIRINLEIQNKLEILFIIKNWIN